jgi:RimJ/RimL family protein N-acetyltransferase
LTIEEHHELRRPRREIRRLKPEKYDRVRSLFRELMSWNATLTALLDGTSPGYVLADDSATPAAAFAGTAEGFFLAGNPTHEGFIEEVNAHLVRRYFNDEPTVAGDGIFLRHHPIGWKDRVAGLFKPREPMVLVGRHYLCTELAYSDWRDHLPRGFTVRRLDADLLADSGLTVPAVMLEQIEENWETRDRFLAHGFGCVAVHEDTISHWSIADCVTKDRHCEIGIWSLPEHRRRGLAAITTAANVEHALRRGFVRVGWQCTDDNVGSYRTAERVGFVLERTATSAYCMFSSVHQEAENGWYHLRNGRPRESAEAYDRLFVLGGSFPDYIHQTAARAFAEAGRPDAALRHLRRQGDDS